MSKLGQVLVVVPAWNEEGSIGAVLGEISRSLPSADVLVVDDFSSDRTAAIARSAGADVISNIFNLGVGGAMRVGFRYAADRGYDALVQIDADGQHDPAYAPALLEALDCSAPGPALVIAARFDSSEDYPVPRARRWAMRLLAAYLSRLTGCRLTDATSGYRAYNRQAVALFARTYPADYLSDTVESLIIASEAGAHISQLSTVMRERTAGLPSQSRARALLYLSRVALMLFLQAIRPRRGRPAPSAAHPPIIEEKP
ncbi:MAG: glycosyltransferase family 2 protein [Acidimicrobiales bacterium]